MFYILAPIDMHMKDVTTDVEGYMEIVMEVTWIIDVLDLEYEIQVFVFMGIFYFSI